MIQKKLVWHFSKFSMNSYKFLKITDFELKGGSGILQPDPQKDLDHCNRVLDSSGKKTETRRPNSGDGGHRRRGGTLLGVM
jgi:hypothetical protein